VFHLWLLTSVAGGEIVDIAAYAFLVGTVELLIGFPLVIAPQKTADWLLRVTKEPLLYRLVGVGFLLICVLVVAEEPRIGLSLDGVIRLIAWWGIVKCLVICWWPMAFSRLSERFLAGPARQRMLGVLALAAGVFFFIAGSVLH
jgi:hypothetical protein